MTHTFRPGDRALLMPTDSRARFWWAPLTVLSLEVECEGIGDIGLPTKGLAHQIEFDEPLLRGPGRDFATAKYLMPLPKNGPDAQIDLARRVMALHGGRE